MWVFSTLGITLVIISDSVESTSQGDPFSKLPQQFKESFLPLPQAQVLRPVVIQAKSTSQDDSFSELPQHFRESFLPLPQARVPRPAVIQAKSNSQGDQFGKRSKQFSESFVPPPRARVPRPKEVQASTIPLLTGGSLQQLPPLYIVVKMRDNSIFEAPVQIGDHTLREPPSWIKSDSAELVPGYNFLVQNLHGFQYMGVLVNGKKRSRRLGGSVEVADIRMELKTRAYFAAKEFKLHDSYRECIDPKTNNLYNTHIYIKMANGQIYSAALERHDLDFVIFGKDHGQQDIGQSS